MGFGMHECIPYGEAEVGTDTLYALLVPVPAGGLTFLSLNKKVSKEVSLGEALTAKPFFLLLQVYPAVARL